MRGHIYYSADGVRDWNQITTPDESALNAAGILDDGSIVLVDQSGRVLRSNDGGHSFQFVPGQQGFPLAGVVQAADGSIVLVGLGGVTRIDVSSLR